MSDLTIRASHSLNSDRKMKWAYVVSQPGYWDYVSDYRYASEATALAAGVRDIAAAKHNVIAEGLDDDQPNEESR